MYNKRAPENQFLCGNAMVCPPVRRDIPRALRVDYFRTSRQTMLQGTLVKMLEILLAILFIHVLKFESLFKFFITRHWTPISSPRFSSNQYETLHRCYKHIEDVHETLHRCYKHIEDVHVTFSRQENHFR